MQEPIEQIIKDIINRQGLSISKTAQTAGMSRQALHQKLKKENNSLSYDDVLKLLNVLGYHIEIEENR